MNSREFLAVGAIGVGPLAYNTAGQTIRINGNGATYVGTGDALDTEATRAVVDMVAGVSNASPPSAPVFVEVEQGLAVTVTYPSNGTTATVRSNYPDLLLAGTTKAKLNPLFVTLYVTIGGETRAFANKLLVDGATQLFNLTDWHDGIVIGAIPSAPAATFCPFEAVSVSAVGISGGSNFPEALAATVRYAFQYDGTSVSAISHARADGALHTAVLDLADIETAFQYWGPPAPTVGDLPSLAVPTGQIRQVNSTGKLYRWTGTLWTLAVVPEFWGNPVANYAALPSAGSVPTGQVRLTLDTGKLYRSTGAAWALASGGGGGGSGVLNSWRLG